jgi:AAA domain-containing protein
VSNTRYLTDEEFVGTVELRAPSERSVEATREGQPEAQPEPHTWTPLDAVELGEKPVEPPELGGLFYPRRRIVVSGEAEAGKSFLGLAVSADELRAGRGVVWVDTDNMGASALLERLRSLGVDDDHIRRLFGFMQPAEPLGAAAADDITRWLAKHKGRLVVFDAFNATLSLHGYEPTSTADVEKFWQRVVDPFCKAGAAVVLLDHVVKRADERGKYAYGSERKLTGADVHLGLRAVEPFGRGRTGKATVTVHKDRPGFLPRPSAGLFVLTSDPGTGRCSWSLKAEDVVTEAGGFRPTRLMEKVSRYLYLAADEPRTRSQVEEDVKGKGIYVRQAIDALVAEGYASELIGDRGARLVKHEALFAEDGE